MSAPQGKLIGIDHGEKIIGIAVCDAIWLTVRPLTRLTRSTREKDFAALNRILAEQRAVGAVVGLPETAPDFDGVSQAETVRNWAARFAGQVPVPVYLWDETFSTFEAREIIAEGGLQRTGRVDDVAAAVILRGFLDAHREGQPFPIPVQPRRK